MFSINSKLQNKALERFAPYFTQFKIELMDHFEWAFLILKANALCTNSSKRGCSKKQVGSIIFLVF